MTGSGHRIDWHRRVRRTMNLDVRVLSGMGHLTTPVHLDEVVSLVAEVVDPPTI
jgi:hypothetical protein